MTDPKGRSRNANSVWLTKAEMLERFPMSEMTRARRSLNPWYVIAWRALWWIPTWGTLFLFCALVSIYSLSIEVGRDAWRHET